MLRFFVFFSVPRTGYSVPPFQAMIAGWGLLIIAVISSGTAQDADSVKTVQERAIASTDTAAQTEDGKFKIYVGTIDGVRREIFNEVEDNGEPIPPNVPEGAPDPFGAYDDNNIIGTEDEKSLFVPKPYRPGADKKEKKKTTTTTTTTTRRPPTTIRTLPPALPTQPPQPRPVVRPAQPQPTFHRPAPQTLPPPTAPPRIQTQPPFRPQPFTQPPPQPQPHFTAAPFRPVPQTLPTHPPQPQTFNPQPPQPQPFRPQPQPTFQRPSFTRPPPTRPPTTAAPRLPFANTRNLRTGVCPASIFYISTPITGPTRLTFTHFAIAVTVDQCARTCHEFNCAIAHYNPSNGHCEFNPSTAFAIRNGQCPAWPSLHYRNNVVAREAVRIFCVQCQRPRRRIGSRTRTSFRSRAFDPRHHTSSRTVGRRSFEHPVIHGVLVKQPQAVALGVSQQQFLTAIESPSADAIAVNVSPVEIEENTDVEPENGIRSRAQGITLRAVESQNDQMAALSELEHL